MINRTIDKDVCRTDGIDAERFRAMLESPAFGRFRKRLEAELLRSQGACERAESEIEVRRAQGAVAALRVAIALPAAIMAEIKKSGE